MTRRQKHPVLRKIASRRWRTEGTRNRSPRSAGTQEALGLNPARQPLPPGERILTPRETEVLYHVARGETDRQIAERLYLSRRTVSNHVSNILSKLAVANRRDAAKAAFRIGLI
jgi:DNA-binding NarL/FixJ family response regulator